MAKAKAKKIPSKAAATGGIRETLTKICVKGFKATREVVQIDVRPLTLLAGQNSAGKSTMVQPLLLMKQTLEATHDPGVLELNGPCVKFNEASQLLWRGRSKHDRARRWEIELGIGEESLRVQYVARSRGFGIDRTQRLRGSNILMDLHPGMTEREKQEVMRTSFGPLPNGYKLESQIVEDRCAHQLEVRLTGEKRSRSKPPVILVRPLPTEMIESVIYLPGLRGHPERSYPVTRASGRYPGAFPPYTASILLSWAEKKDQRIREVSEDLQRLGLTWKVSPGRLGDTHVEIRVGRLPHPQQGGALDLVNIADVGFGASQVLPVVVALRAAQPGQVVHIEQPELHLHPNAQVAMAELLIAAAARGARLIVETHSSVLLKRVQVAVAQGEQNLSPDDVALHWFTRDEKGAARVTSANLAPDGSYGDWPVDFADVEMKVEQDFIDAAVARMSAK